MLRDRVDGVLGRDGEPMMSLPVAAMERARDASVPTASSGRGTAATDSRASSRRLRPSQVPLVPRGIPGRSLGRRNDPLEQEAEAVRTERVPARPVFRSPLRPLKAGWAGCR